MQVNQHEWIAKYMLNKKMPNKYEFIVYDPIYTES